MSRWDKLRDNAGFVVSLLSLVLTVWFGFNVGNVFDVTRPYFIVPYGVIMFALGCAAGYSFRSGMKARKARADFERERWEKAEAERAEAARREAERADWARNAADSLSNDERELVKMLVERGSVYVVGDILGSVMHGPFMARCYEVGERNRDVVQLLPNGRARDVYEAANLASYADPGLMEHAAREGECMREHYSGAAWWWPCGGKEYDAWLATLKASRDEREAARAAVEAGEGTVVASPGGMLFGEVYDGGEQRVMS